ncbi:MAG TPA: DapH/DapD/GlmU-related protein [Clostridia bacterium]|nr:DapH/DapD/GlmU-related protein [Clostridia bacterium]
MALSTLQHEPGFRYTCVLRCCGVLRRRKGMLARLSYVAARLLLQHYTYKFGYQIPDTAEIGPGLFMNHLGATVINPAAKLGSNINLHGGITIGQTNRGKAAGAPVIGDRVWIGANAAIVGGITIGDDVMIAPNAYVNFDVPSHCVVVGNPGQIVSTGGTEGYINNRYDVGDARMLPEEALT